MNKSFSAGGGIASAKTDMKTWVQDMASFFEAEDVYWCDGSDEEYNRFCQQLVDKGTFIKLNQEKRPKPVMFASAIQVMLPELKTELLSAAEKKMMQDRPITGWTRKT